MTRLETAANGPSPTNGSLDGALLQTRPRVLVIDDEPAVVKAIHKVLSKAGYRVVGLVDPLKVEDAIVGLDLNLVITDLKMPRRDGLETLSTIRSLDPKLPVVVLTGFGTIDTAVQAMRLGAVEFLTKPLSTKELLRAVRNHMNYDGPLPEEIQQLLEYESTPDLDAASQPPENALSAEEVPTEEGVPAGFEGIDFADLLPGQFFSFAVFLQIFNKKTQRSYLKRVIRKNTVLTSGMFKALAKREVEKLFIHRQDKEEFQEYTQAVKASPVFQQKRHHDQRNTALYKKTLSVTEKVLSTPSDSGYMAAARDLVRELVSGIRVDPMTYHEVVDIGASGSSVFHHSANVCLLSINLGVFMGLESDRIAELGMGALFHDVGMLWIRSDILQKTDRLTNEDWREIRKHCQLGYDLMRQQGGLTEAELKMILEHQERTDGSGYPRGLKGADISFPARLISVIDRFDSMTSHRSYRYAFTPAEAMKRIFIEERTDHNKQIIQKFAECLSRNKGEA
ncbi:MAG: response regulator [Proteobacteria bacterium]|nr:response regulator [Pseudomonadota bacterium]